MKNTPLEYKITNLARPVIEDLGFNLVLVEFKGGVLQILAEDPKTRDLGLEDCTEITKILSPLLEVEDPIAGAYTLEISSPGIDRPLVRNGDFERYKGFEAKIELDEMMEGQKRFRGRIINEDKDFVTLLVDKVEHKIEIAVIKKARLVLTDELIKATRMENIILNGQNKD